MHCTDAFKSGWAIRVCGVRLRRRLTLGPKPRRFFVLEGGATLGKEGVLGMLTKADRRSAVIYSQVEAGAQAAKPVLHQRGHEIQPYGKIAHMLIALDEQVCAASAENLNQVLADTITLCDLYKKHHWQVAGHTFYQLHLLFDKHYNEQNELVDTIAERIQSLGAIGLAMAADVSETTIIPRPPRGREEVPVQISRLLEAHEIVLKEARTMARQASEAGDDGTNDLFVSDVIRTNELQVWFLAEHAVGTLSKTLTSCFDADWRPANEEHRRQDSRHGA